MSMPRFPSLPVLMVLALALTAANLDAQGITRVVRPNQGFDRRGVQPLRIDLHKVVARIEGEVARTTITQVFRNPNEFVAEGRYLFPISDDASLTEFTMVMNGKTVKGELLEKEKAREIYEGIVATMRDPALLEYVGAGLFSAQVFPIPARGTVEISLSYVEKLRVDAGVAEYRYPLKTRAFSPEAVGQVVVDVSIAAAAPLKTVFSSSHEIREDRKGEKETRISFEGKEVDASRDFQLYWTLSESDFGLHLLTEKTIRDGGFFMMTLAPSRGVEARPEPRDVVFVVDTSGSMKTDQKMDQARAALLHGLTTLREEDRFEIIPFSTEARPWGGRLVPAAASAIAEASKFVKGLEATGGTNIHDALLAALSCYPADDARVKMIIFVTDGLPTIAVTEPARILATVAEKNAAKVRLFAVGVGYDVNADLLDSLADQSGGERDYVTPSQNLEVRLSSFFDKVASPVLTGLAIEADGIKLLDVQPRRLPDLFKGSQLFVCGRYEGEGMHAIRLRGKLGGVEKEWIFEGRFASESTGRDFIPVMWARRQAAFLWDTIRRDGFQKELRDAIVELGKRYGIATAYTSFLVTEGEPTAAETRRHGRWARGGENVRDRLADDEATDLFYGVPARRAGGGTSSADGKAPAADAARPGGTPAAPGTLAPSAGKEAVIESLMRKKLADSGPAPEEKAKSNDDLAEMTESEATAVLLVDGRSFHERSGVWVDIGIDKLEKEAVKKLEKIELFSTRWSELSKEHPELRKCAARMTEFVILLGDRVFWIHPAAEPAPVPENPKKD